MEQKLLYEVKSAVHVVPLQQRNWPRWTCPRCKAQHYLEIDSLMAVTHLTCRGCKTQWNVLVRFESATSKPKRKSEDDIVTDWDNGATLAEDAQDKEND